MQTLPSHQADGSLDALSQVGCELERDVPLGPKTWYGIGGTARCLAHPQDTQQLSRLVAVCNELGLPVRVLGKGANLLVCEGVVGGVTVSLDGMKAVEICGESGRVAAQAGADLEKLITATVRVGLSGLEVLAGIPATVGGALRMNAGGAFGSVGPVVQSITCVEPDGRVTEHPRDALRFEYRRSNIGQRIVAEAVLGLRPVSDTRALREKLIEVMAYKKKSQPMAASSAGCAFKNPPKDVSERGAGKLMDDAGLKGFCIGGAQVSPVHANFITLDKTGRAADVLAVMDHAQAVVLEKFGITLEREVVVWGAE